MIALTEQRAAVRRFRWLAMATPAAAGLVWVVRHRRSAAVRSWSAPTLAGRRYGPLYARSGGDGETAFILLHGLVSTGDVFGAAFDDLANEGRVVVPDLLGFGRSLDANRDSFTADDQLDALDRLAEHLGLFDCRWVIGAHSMGSPLAVRWAARHEERVERVVGWGAPMYESPEAATASLAGDLMGELFALDTRWAEAACAVSCRHRTLAGWITAAAKPTLPVPISRAVSHHTWPAYRDSVQYLVMDVEWHALLAALDRAGTPVELVWGANDVIGDVEYAHTVIDQGEHSRVTLVPEVDHYLPLTNPAICLSQLLNRP